MLENGFCGQSSWRKHCGAGKADLHLECIYSSEDKSLLPPRWKRFSVVTSVVSDSVRPHRQQPTGLPHPWDSPGKNTGVGCHFLLQCMKVKSERKVAQSCPTLSDPIGLQHTRLLRPCVCFYSRTTCFDYYNSVI